MENVVAEITPGSDLWSKLPHPDRKLILISRKLAEELGLRIVSFDSTGFAG